MDRDTAPAEAARRALLRHTLATVAYRGGKAVRGAPADFGGYRITESGRTPGEILAHIGDLFDWGLAMVTGDPRWREDPPREWVAEVERFHRCLERFDDYLASDAPLFIDAERLFQGPIADALTHVGQLALLRRAFGAPIRGENYAMADVVAGRLGAAQAEPRREFD